MIRASIPAAIGLLLAACASADKAGIRDPEDFRRVARQVEFASPLPPADVARCFEERAALLPMSVVRPGDDASRWTYRLRGYGFTFEEIDFAAAAGGSTITTRLAPNLDRRWQRDFERDRLAPLRRCAGVAP